MPENASKPSFIQQNKTIILRIAGIVLLLIPYFLYLAFIIRTDQGPVDYETFMDIGHRLRTGTEVYGENSYYPFPFVCIFAFFDWLPRPLSMIIWFLAPVVMALAFSGWNPLILLFAPLFGHFLGGQTAALGMLGLWGYRRSPVPESIRGGIFLALTLLKPQLGIVPFVFAAVQWLRYMHQHRRIPRQAWAWAGSMLLLYLPGFFFMPDWFAKWLHNPRPLAQRAMSGFVPRSLLFLLERGTPVYWLALSGIALLLLAGIWFLCKKGVSLDLAVLWGFVISPIVHDYDLIQVVPLLENPKSVLMALLLSLPGWLVMLFAYDQDPAWYWFTLIAPGILCFLLWQEYRTRDR